jgi:hypothetical protein
MTIAAAVVAAVAAARHHSTHVAFPPHSPCSALHLTSRTPLTLCAKTPLQVSIFFFFFCCLHYCALNAALTSVFALTCAVLFLVLEWHHITYQITVPLVMEEG